MSARGWIGVDLDGCLAEYRGWQGADHIGDPVPAMVERVKRMLAHGEDVRIFTARVGARGPGEVEQAVAVIQRWCERHLGRPMPVTATKDFSMKLLYDDRCVQIEPNTGRRMDGVDDLI